MSEISKLTRLLDGASRSISLSTNTLVVDNIKAKLGGSFYVTLSGTLSGNRTLVIPDENVNLGSLNPLVVLSGVSSGDINLGSFTGITIPDNSSIKDAFQSLETYLENNLSGDFLDASFRISDEVDTDKKIAFEASAITSGATRTISMPDEDVDLGLVNQTSILLGDEITIREDADIDFENRISALEFDSVTGTYVDAADAALNARLLPLEEIASTKVEYVYRGNASVYGSGFKGSRDPGPLFREGWYFKNSITGSYINWLFFESLSVIQLDDFSAYAVMTFDNNTEAPIFTIETEPTGSGDAGLTFHSKIVYTSPMVPATMVSTKYVVYFGLVPAAHPELPRIQLTLDTVNSIGDQLLTENVARCYFSSNALATTNSVEYMVEKLGVKSLNFKYEASLSIKEISDKYALTLSSPTNLTYVDLLQQVIPNSLIVSVDRILLHEDDDYTLSLVPGSSGLVTRLTWIGDVAIGGSSALSSDDHIRFTYRYDT